MKVKNISSALVVALLIAGCGEDSTIADDVKNSDNKSQPHKVKRILMDNLQKDALYQYNISPLFPSTTHLLFIIRSDNDIDIKHMQFYIDTDNDTTTGYSNGSQEDTGAEYLIEDNLLFKYKGNGGLDWNWEVVTDDVGDYLSHRTPNASTRVLNKNLIPELGEVFSTKATILNENWEAIDYTISKKYIFKTNRLNTSILEDWGTIKVELDEYENALHFKTTLKDENFKGNVQYFLDTDNNSQTGYTNEFFSAGYEYLLENERVYKYTEENEGEMEGWTLIDSGHFASAGGKFGSTFLKSSIDITQKQLQIAVLLTDQEWTVQYNMDTNHTLSR